MIHKLATLALLLALATTAQATGRHVTTTGSSSGQCPVGTPCTFARAAAIVNPGDTVYVYDGTYTSSALTFQDFTRGGNATAGKVVWKSLNKWGAKISGQSDAKQYAFKISAPQIRIQDFDIYEWGEIAIWNSSGDSVEIVGNHIHHIARTRCSNSINGFDAYYSQGRRKIVIDGNVFNDIGRKFREGGCADTAVAANNDQGIYGIAFDLVISNNIFYNFRVGWPIQIYCGSSCVTPSGPYKIWGNTFVGKMTKNTATQAGHIIIYPPAFGLSVRNNIFYDPRMPLFKMNNTTTEGEVIGNMLTVPQSALFNMTENAVTQGPNTWNTDPQFTSLSYVNGETFANPNFRPICTSPAIDAGGALPGITATIDIEGNPRPAGLAYDIGAYENIVGVPATITNVAAATAGDGHSATLTFTSSGLGLTEYDVRFGEIPITDDNFYDQSRFMNVPPPTSVCGANESFTFSGLCPGTSYYIAIKVKNASGWSAMSNVYPLNTAGVADPTCGSGIE